jgi:hypothetical protein
MSTKHQKKRNSLLVYEFLVRTISKSLIEDDKKKSRTALKILKRHFKPGSELYKEFRLMNALAKTTVSSDHVAASIIKESKAASTKLDVQKLDREKSILIRNINHVINDEYFYDQHINEYRTYATIQTLLNEWRSEDKDIHRVAQFEDQLMTHLLTKKEQGEDPTISEDSSGTARLVMKVMTKKLNEKYNGVLNDSQKSIIKAYAYSTASDDMSSVKMKLREIKEELIGLVETYSAEVQSNEYIKGKLQEAKTTLLTENLDVVDDDTVTRFMLYSHLIEELGSKE